MPDTQMFTDEFIGEVIGIARLTKLVIELPTAPGGDWMSQPVHEEGRVLASVELIDPRDGDAYAFHASDKTMGLALRTVREQIREHTGR